MRNSSAELLEGLGAFLPPIFVFCEILPCTHFIWEFRLDEDLKVVCPSFLRPRLFPSRGNFAVELWFPSGGDTAPFSVSSRTQAFGPPPFLPSPFHAPLHNSKLFTLCFCLFCRSFQEIWPRFQGVCIFRKVVSFLSVRLKSQCASLGI